MLSVAMDAVGLVIRFQFLTSNSHGLPFVIDRSQQASVTCSKQMRDKMESQCLDKANIHGNHQLQNKKDRASSFVITGLFCTPS